jgi:CPA2 family monovalent cation:H+ antiporter-2
MLFAGRKFFPWVMNKVAETGSRELFTLFVIGVPISVALFAAHSFGVSLALGAFLAGMVMNESDLSHHAAARAMPLQDAFAVLFFVATGMSFDPRILITHTGQVGSAVAFAVVFTPTVAFLLVVFGMRYSSRIAAVVAPSLAQIGEFSLVLATLGVRLGVLPNYAYATIVGAVLISICLHSLTFDKLHQIALMIKISGGEPVSDHAVCALKDHVVLVGYGRVGSAVGETLRKAGLPFAVVEENRDIAQQVRAEGIPCIFGNADIGDVLHEAAVDKCKLVIVTSPDAFSVRLICDEVKQLNPNAAIVVRTHSESEAAYLQEKEQVKLVVFAENEVAKSIASFVKDTKLVEGTQAS